MPVVSAGNLTKLRTTRHSCLMRLAFYNPAVMWTARIDGTQTTGDTTVTVKSVVQTKAPMTDAYVTFGSAPLTADYGTARWRSYSAPTLTVAPHDSLLIDNGYVTVWEEIKPTSK